MPGEAHIIDHPDAPRRGPAADRGARVPDAEARPFDARSMQAELERSLSSINESETAAAAAKTSFVFGAASRRIAKICVGVVLVVSFGWSPMRAMLATTSVEALVNVRIETIRSPIDGFVELGTEGVRSWRAPAPPPLLRVVDKTADHARLYELRRQYDALDAQARMIARQTELSETALQALQAQVERFRKGRLKLIDARLAAQSAELDAAVAKTAQVTASKNRSDALKGSGAISAAEHDRAKYEWSAATAAEAAARRHLEETKVERDAVADGVFVGDSYNDRPSSDQRAAELRLRVGDLKAQAEAARSQLKLLSEQIAEEDARDRERSSALVVLPESGRVWEMLTGAGEYVSKGQDLLRVLDCSHPLVSANVDERVYNRLVVGGPATFVPLESGGKTYAGTIVNLTGASGASANFAIPPAAMRKSPFYDTIALDGMSDEGCSVGRTGTVTFDAARAARPVHANGVALRTSLF